MVITVIGIEEETNMVATNKIFLTSAIFAVAMTLVLTFNFFLPDNLQVNESLDYKQFYLVIGERLQSGEAPSSAFRFSNFTENALPVPMSEPGLFITQWPPGMPYLLSAILDFSLFMHLDSNQVIKFFFIILYCSTAVVIFYLARNYMSIPFAFLAAMMWAGYPLNLWLTKQPNSEIPFSFCFVLAIYFLCQGMENRKTPFFIACGLALGIAINFRAIGLLLPLVFCLVAHLNWNRLNLFKIQARQIYLIGVMLTMSYVAIMPWEFLVYQNTGRIIPMATGVEDMQDNYNKFLLEPKPNGGVIVSENLESYLIKQKCPPSNEKAFVSKCQTAKEQKTPNSFLANAELVWIQISRPFYGIYTKRAEEYVLTINALVFSLMFLGIREAIRLKLYSMCFLLLGCLGYFYLVTLNVIPVVRYLVPGISICTLFIPLYLQRVKQRFF